MPHVPNSCTAIVRVRKPNAIARAWEAASEEPLFVITNGRVYLVEAPWERSDAAAEREMEDDLGRDAAEAVLRVFTVYEDAVRYCEMQREERDVDSSVMHVARTNLEGIFALLSVIQQNAQAAFGVPVRVDFCRMSTSGVKPVAVDTLAAEFTTYH